MSLRPHRMSQIRTLATAALGALALLAAGPVVAYSGGGGHGGGGGGHGGGVSGGHAGGSGVHAGAYAGHPGGPASAPGGHAFAPGSHYGSSHVYAPHGSYVYPAHPHGAPANAPASHAGSYRPPAAAPTGSSPMTSAAHHGGGPYTGARSAYYGGGHAGYYGGHGGYWGGSNVHYAGWHHYWYGGAWYWWGGVYPIGLYCAALPLYYTTIWWGGVPYYYADYTFYHWNDGVGQYEVVPPPGDESAASGSAASGAAASDVYVYPRQGQSPEQQQQDRYECYRWAADQTGFDPTRPDGGGNAADPAAASGAYHRAETACLEGRGYTVR